VNDQRRLLLAVVLSSLVLFVWGRYFTPKRPVPSGADGGAVAAVTPPVANPTNPTQPVVAGNETNVDGGSAAVAAVTPPTAMNVAPNNNSPRPPEEKVEFDSPLRRFVFSSYGGALSNAVLKGEQFKRRVEGADQQVDLVNVLRPGPQAFPLSSQLGKGLPEVPLDQPYSVQKTDDGVTFTAQVGALTIIKRYHVPADGYDVQLDVTLKSNDPAQTLSGEMTEAITGYEPPGKQESGGFFSNRGPSEARVPIARLGGKTDRHAADKDKGPQVQTGPVSFAGLDERYFLLVAYPVTTGEVGTVTLSSVADGTERADLTFPVSIPAGHEFTRSFGVFLGPKHQETLQEAGNSIPTLKAAKPELETSVDYGFVAVICAVLLKVLRFFHGLVPNWGIAIILLTISVKAVLFPLTNKQMASMEAMRKLQPQIEALKLKYPEDKERQNMEMMKLYSENKVNPLGGCLPMIVQMPVWWGLYRTLEYAFDLYRQPFIHGWINDLSVMDPTYILPIAMGASMYLTQRLQPQMGDPTQAKMMLYFMPVFFTFIMKSLPSGLNLYIFCNNLLSIGQQMWLRRRYPGAATPGTRAVAKAKG
jgi:YidC/Oxa1 family membrane protein insertase